MRLSRRTALKGAGLAVTGFTGSAGWGRFREASSAFAGGGYSPPGPALHRMYTFWSRHAGTGIDLVSGRKVALNQPARIPPQSTMVWFDPKVRS
jgi:hypothetical protein